MPEASLSFRIRRGLFRKAIPRLISYEDVAERATAAPTAPYPRWPSVTPGFDNSARRGNLATILLDPSPAIYRNWLLAAMHNSDSVANNYPDGSGGLVFINAWNEWAEGNHLEPDQENGHAYLSATREAIRSAALPALTAADALPVQK